MHPFERSRRLIPKIVKGSWLVKQSVGETPVLLGHKLTTKYFRCASYCQHSITNLTGGRTRVFERAFSSLS